MESYHGCKNKDKPYVKLFSMEKATFDNFNFKLLEGNFPKNENEIIISKHIMTNGEVELKLGDKVNFDIGKRQTEDGYDLEANNPYNYEEQEKLVNTRNYEFTVVRNNRKTFT